MMIPEDMKVKRSFPSDPLGNLPTLPQQAPMFVPTDKVTRERMEKLEEGMSKDLSEEERCLLKHAILINEKSIAFDENERGTFRRDYFSDYKIPVIDHTPWMDRNIPLPKGYVNEIIRMLKEKISAGVYEESQSPYRSRWCHDWSLLAMFLAFNFLLSRTKSTCYSKVTLQENTKTPHKAIVPWY
jgi:hypothetical protein